MMMLVKACLFGASSLGYWDYFRRKSGIAVYFLPVATVAVQFCILFLGGILHILYETSLVLYVLGFLLLADGIRKEKAAFLKPYWNWGYGFFLLGLAAACVFLRGKIFTHGDNFSHWALIVQKMLETNRFPNYSDTLLIFPNYPLGSSTYIYYFCKMVESGESVQMLAQSYMMIAAVLPLFAFAQKRQLISGVVFTSLTVMIFGYSIRITELLVDTMLPLVGMAAICFALYECRRETPAEGRKTGALWLLGAMLVWTTQIKNPGLIFAMLAVLLLLADLRRDHHFMWQKLLVCASPLLSVFLWNRHCAESFPPNVSSKHAMTAVNYMQTASEKNMEHMQWIAKETVRFFFSRAGFFWILLWLAVLFALTLAFRRGMLRRFGKLAATTAGLHVIYVVGVIAMYLLSMPLDEAMSLASIERYARTLDISVYYLLAVYGAVLISEIPLAKAALVSGVLLVALSVATLKKMPDSRPWMTREHRLVLENTLSAYGVERGQSCFICIPAYDKNHFFRVLGTYLLDTLPYTVTITEEAQLDGAENYDVLVNLDGENPIVQAWIAENVPEQMGECVIYLPKSLESQQK